MVETTRGWGAVVENTRGQGAMVETMGDNRCEEEKEEQLQVDTHVLPASVGHVKVTHGLAPFRFYRRRDGPEMSGFGRRLEEGRSSGLCLAAEPSGPPEGVGTSAVWTARGGRGTSAR